MAADALPAVNASALAPTRMAAVRVFIGSSTSVAVMWKLIARLIVSKLLVVSAALAGSRGWNSRGKILKIDQRAADLTANQYVSFARTRSTDAQRQSFADLDADCELA